MCIAQQKPAASSLAWPAGAVVLACALLSACAGSPVGTAMGTSGDDLVKRIGEPTSRYERAGQKRLEYASGPYGKFTWMVDLDDQGRVKSVEQVLTDAQFALVRPGESAADLLWSLGRPSERGRAMYQQRIWAYRYDTPLCRWFVITVLPDDTVKDAGFLTDPMCDPPMPD